MIREGVQDQGQISWGSQEERSTIWTNSHKLYNHYKEIKETSYINVVRPINCEVRSNS